MNNDGKNGSPSGFSWWQARKARLSQGGPKGMQASMAGFTLAGPIVGGFLVGWWLDNKFGTQYWVLILGLLGVFSGFRELFALVKKVEPKPEDRTLPAGRKTVTPQPLVKVEDKEQRRPLMFSVPGPFDEDGEDSAAAETAQETLARLMGEGEKSDDE